MASSKTQKAATIKAKKVDTNKLTPEELALIEPYVTPKELKVLARKRESPYLTPEEFEAVMDQYHADVKEFTREQIDRGEYDRAIEDFFEVDLAALDPQERERFAQAVAKMQNEAAEKTFRRKQKEFAAKRAQHQHAKAHPRYMAEPDDEGVGIGVKVDPRYMRCKREFLKDVEKHFGDANVRTATIPKRDQPGQLAPSYEEWLFVTRRELDEHGMPTVLFSFRIPERSYLPVVQKPGAFLKAADRSRTKEGMYCEARKHLSEGKGGGNEFGVFEAQPEWIFR